MKNGFQIKSDVKAGSWCYQYAKRKTDPVTTVCGFATEAQAFSAVQALGVAVYRRVAEEGSL